MCLAMKPQASWRTQTLCDRISLLHGWGNWRWDIQRLAHILQVVHEDSIPNYFWNRLCAFHFLFLSQKFLPLLSILHTWLLGYPILWVHVTSGPEDMTHTMTRKSRPEVKRVTKSKEQTCGWMSLPHTGLSWDSRGCMGWSIPQTAPSHTSCPERALLYSGTRWNCHSSF